MIKNNGALIVLKRYLINIEKTNTKQRAKYETFFFVLSNFRKSLSENNIFTKIYNIGMKNKMKNLGLIYLFSRKKINPLNTKIIEFTNKGLSFNF